MKDRRKKERLNSLKARVENSKVGDVTLAEFADSKVPKVKGRLRKSKTILQEVSDDNLAEFSDSEVPTVKGRLRKSKNNPGEGKKLLEEDNQNEFTEYPLKIWLLVADYISPEDIKSFSLICKASLSVVNTPLFWIRLYKRYYNKQYVIPKCLSYGVVDYHFGLKQRVIRSLYYMYSPFVSAASNFMPSVETSVGSVCLQHWVYSLGVEDSGETSKWIYNFKLCNRSVQYIFKNKYRSSTQINNIHHNKEKGCSILKVVGREFIALPNVMGMRMDTVKSSSKSLVLTFTSAPLLRKPVVKTGMVSIELEFNQSPRLIPWWHPDYWEHGKCCNLKKF